MGRLHLLELNDSPWVPRTLRRYMVEYLACVERLAARKLRAFLPPLSRALDAGGTPEVIDLCSGAGGPWPVLRAALAEDDRAVRVRLTDIAPAPEYVATLDAREGLEYVSEPVDATRVPAHLRGTRVMFNGMHHFRPAVARQILADAQRQRQPIAIFEMISRRPQHILTMPLIAVAVLVLTPLIRPFRWGRLLWTYVVPFLPLAIAWDGMVSALRVYSKEELAELVADLHADDYEWVIGEVATVGPPAPYLLGLPRRAPGQ